MALRQLLLDAASGWQAYRERGRVDSTQEEYLRIHSNLPKALEALAPKDRLLKTEGSTGLGNITAAPWIATFDTRITDSATRGYYIVYLFSVDLSTLYLCMGLGATQFAAVYKKTKERHSQLEIACGKMRAIMHYHIRAPMDARLKTGRIDLSTRPSDGLHQDYEHGAIYWVRYDLNLLPDDDVLAADYRGFLDLYNASINDPLTPKPWSLLKSVVGDSLSNQKPLVKIFVPRPPQKVRKVHGNVQGRRYAQDAKVIGDEGEQIVLKYERERLIEANRPNLAARVIHEEALGNRPGWDISSFTVEGTPIHIEVKASETDSINTVELTINEWEAAAHVEESENYYLYLVTNVFFDGNRKIEILKNPMARIGSGELVITPIRYLLDLHKNV